MFYDFPQDFKALELFPGFLVRAVSGYRLMFCHVTLQPHSEHPLHSHPQEQMGIILEGEFEMTVGDETKLLKKGDIYLAPPNVMHGGVTRTEQTFILDTVSPPIEELK